MKRVPGGTAYGLSDLTVVTMPNSVTKIGEYAFSECSGLKSINIPNSVTTISDWAFVNCTGLTKITCHAVTPPVAATDCFVSYLEPSIYDQATLYVPKESVEAYKVADEWKKFTHIMGIGEEPLLGDANGDGEVNIADVTTVIDLFIIGDYDPAMDINGDGEVNIADINLIINLILSGTEGA